MGYDGCCAICGGLSDDGWGIHVVNGATLAGDASAKGRVASGGDALGVVVRRVRLRRR